MIKFGTDGWRAIIAEDFTFENVKVVSQAIAGYLKKQKKGRIRVVIGYDSRFLSKEFARTCALTLAANNLKVVLAHSFVPTPTISFSCRYGRYDLGIVITASHNPPHFNGLKIKTRDGASADKSITDSIERFLYKNKVHIISEEQALKEKKLQIKNLIPAQVQFLKNFIDLEKIKKLKLKILIDPMYGSGVGFIDKVLGKSKIKLDYIHSEFNPSFGGIHPEPIASNLKSLIQKVKKEKYDFGVALDGDADRIALVDRYGNYINAQVILPLLALHLIKNRKVKGGIGKTVVGSNVVNRLALSLGVSCYETPIGFKYLSHLFEKNLISIGGEEAGGIGVKGYIPERDGSLSFLLLLEMLACERCSFDRLLTNFYKKYGKWYYDRTAISIKSIKKSLDALALPQELLGKKVERINALDGIKLITKDSWLMLRKSGTEPIVRVYAESKSRDEAKRLVALGEKMIYAL